MTTVRFVQPTYTIAVHDVEASARYYVETLGFSALDIDAPGWRFVQRDGVRFDMGECPDVPEAKTLGDHSWIARIFVEGLDAYCAEIAPRGARITSGPTNKPWGLREMSVETPDGHRLMFCEPVG